MPLSIGDKLGHYEILAPIGAGGMGEVYRARDTKLKRDVALKVLPDSFANDPERMARFQREAEVLASLNHPHIAQIYGVEERALAMELVEGEAPKGPLPFDDAWKIASQIAAALEYAHDKGIIHRDLKPANIKVTPDGTVKLLDFGLAKAFTNQREPQTSVENSPTLTIAATEVGVILGTAAYMPPEQAKGKSVDRRADIWSFGVVLYELLTGARAFQGEDVSETLVSVIRDEPDLSKIPLKARKLLGRCLEKDPKKRLRDIGEAAYLLEAAPLTAPSALRTGNAIPWTATGLVTVLLAVLAFIHFREAQPEQRSVRYQIPAPGKTAVQGFKLSPDGRYLAFTAPDGGVDRVWIRPLDSLQQHALPATDGATYPFFSPDSSHIGFFAQGKLKRIAVTGGPPQTLCDAPDPRGGAWGPDGDIVFAPGVNSVLYRVRAEGGAPTPVAKLTLPSGSGGSLRFPDFLPRSKRFFYVALGNTAETTGLYVGSLDGVPPVRVLPDASHAAYVPPAAPAASGHLVFRRESTLLAQPFDSEHLRATGEVFPLADQIGEASNTGFSAFSASWNGTLVYQSGAGIAIRELVWRDRSGKLLGTITKPDLIYSPALSPDERRLAFSLGNQSSSMGDIWLQDLARGAPSRFTFGPDIRENPVWSPDGASIAFTFRTASGGFNDLYQKPSSGAGKEQLLLHGGTNAFASDWSRDGKLIVFSQTGDNTKDDLWLLPLDGDRKPRLYLQTSFYENQGQFSLDGRWMAYSSDESGQFQVYVQPIPPNGAKWQISSAGGSQPRWRPDGKELFYAAPDRKLVAVPVKIDSSFAAGVPVALFEGIELLDLAVDRALTYRPAADGQRFLVSAAAGGDAAAATPLTVVTNWTAGLKK
jgi:serine/threonine protein kinase